MKTFYIFQNNNKKEDFKVFDNGFSFLAIVTGPLWGLVNNTWFYAFLNLSVGVFIYFFLNNSLVVFILLSNIFWGFFGKDLRIQEIIFSNFKFKKMVCASSSKKALLTYFSNNS